MFFGLVLWEAVPSWPRLAEAMDSTLRPCERPRALDGRACGRRRFGRPRFGVKRGTHWLKKVGRNR